MNEDHAALPGTFRVAERTTGEPPAGRTLCEVSRHAAERRSPRVQRPGARPKVIARLALRRQVAAGRVEAAVDEHPSHRAVAAARPRTRADCEGGVRPCPFVGCKHHLYLSVNPSTGAITFTFPDKEPDELEETCSLDVAEQEDLTLERIGELSNLTRERIRQLEVRALLVMKTMLRGAAEN